MHEKQEGYIHIMSPGSVATVVRSALCSRLQLQSISCHFQGRCFKTCKCTYVYCVHLFHAEPMYMLCIIYSGFETLALLTNYLYRNTCHVCTAGNPGCEYPETTFTTGRGWLSLIVQVCAIRIYYYYQYARWTVLMSLHGKHFICLILLWRIFKLFKFLFL